MTALACAGLQVYLIPVRLPSTNICAGVKSEMGTRLGVGKRQICFLRPRHQLTFAKGFLSNWQPVYAQINQHVQQSEPKRMCSAAPGLLGRGSGNGSAGRGQK